MFRILSLDGGGIMGAFTAGVLTAFDEVARAKTGKGLAEQFDLITGTSIGGITAISLGMGVTPDRILQLYRKEGASIFPRGSGATGWVGGFFRSLFGPKYTSNALRKAVEGVVGESKLAQARTRLVIPAYDAVRGRVYLFKTPHAPPPGDNRDADKRAVDVALATSAAPTYFRAHVVPGRGPFIDGGIWANCPAMVGVVEAVEFCNRPLTEVAVLSVSTTSYPFRLGEKQLRGGLLGWGPRIIETFMFGQVQAAVAQATCVLRDRFHRVDYKTEPNLYRLDGVRAVEELIRLGVGVGQEREHTEAFRRLFLRPAGEPPTWPAGSTG